MSHDDPAAAGSGLATVRRRIDRTRLVALVCLLVVAAGIFARQAWRTASERPYQPLTASADPLRASFNDEIGQVRIVMLVAPT
jgi:hypothetical protein